MRRLALCCRIVSSSVESTIPVAAAAFFDLDKTIISRSSTLAFGPSFYRHGLLSRSDMHPGRRGPADRFRAGGRQTIERMEKIRDQVSQVCRGWPADRVSRDRQPVPARPDPPVRVRGGEGAADRAPHRWPGRDHRQHVRPGNGGPDRGSARGGHGHRNPDAGGGRPLHRRMEFYAYGEAKAGQVRTLAAERGYSLPHCYAYSDSVTDLPMLETVGNPRVVNPDRALRRVAQQRGWPVLAFGAGRTPPARVSATRERNVIRQIDRDH